MLKMPHMKTMNDFNNSLSLNAPPANLSVYLQALWYDAKDQWGKAHSLVDSLEDNTACWVHAYLHRKEGDVWNADYWYRKAGRVRPGITLDEEWKEIVTALL